MATAVGAGAAWGIGGFSVTRSWRTSAATVLSLAAGLTFLSGFGAAGATAARLTAANPINAAFICSCTGPLSSSVEIGQPAFKAWVSYVNAKGGVNGHKVNVTYYDDTSSPTTSVTQINQILAANPAVIIDASGEDNDWVNTVSAANVPIIPANSSSLIAFSSADVFTPSQTIDSLPMAVALTAKKLGLSNYGLLYCAESPTCQQLVSIEKADGQKIGVNLVYTTSISASSPSYTAPCLAAQQAGAKGLFVATALQPAIKAAADCVRQNYHPVFIGDDGAIANSFNKSAGWSNGMVGIQPDIPWFVTNTASTQTMYGAWRKYQPGILKDPNFNELAVEGWASGLLLAAAVQGANAGASTPVTAATVLNGMYTIHNNTLGGISPALTFTKGAKANLTDCWFLMRTSNGRYTTPYGLRTFCLPPA